MKYEPEGKELTIGFIGRKVGSIGITYPITVSVFYPHGVSEPPVTNEDIKEYFEAQDKGEHLSRVFLLLHDAVGPDFEHVGRFHNVSIKEV